MKYISIVFLLTMVYSCGPVIDGDLRAFFSARIVDSNGNSLENTEVVTASYDLVYRSSIYHSKLSVADPLFILGSGVSDSNGAVSFLSLLYGSSTYVIIESDNFDPYTFEVANSIYNDDLDFNLPEIVLKPTASVHLEFVNATGTIDPFQATVVYEGTSCSQFTFDGIQETFSCDNFASMHIDDSTIDNFLDLNMAYPSTLKVEYIDSSGATVINDFDIINSFHDFIISY